MIQDMASPSIYISYNGAIIPTDLVSDEENELRLKNARLRSKLETFACFIARLTLYTSLFPSAASSSSWPYRVAVMTALSLEEVVSLARHGTPMWTNERLDLNEYYSKFFPWYARNSPGFVHEVSRASALIPSDASSIVANLMDLERWPKIFPSIVAALSTESQHREFLMINMDFMPVMTPIIQTHNVEILRCSKQIENDTWVIADISVYFSSYERHFRPHFLRFPSGYIVQHVANGVSMVTILDHWVYKEEVVRNQSRPYLVNPNSGFGAQRWLAALQRHFYNTCLTSIPSIGHYIQMFGPICHTNLLNLSTLMVYLFCTGVHGVTGQKWKRFRTVLFPVNIRVFTREGRVVSGVPCSLVSATGLASMQAKPETIFGLINHAKKKDMWNYLQPLGDIKEVIRINRSLNPGNEVSVFGIERNGSTSKDWCLIQETYFEASAAMIIHSFVEATSLAAVINGGDFSGVKLLPCGITIVPCGQEECVVSVGCQIIADQAMVMSPNYMVNYLEEMVNSTLENVENALPVSLNLR